MLTGRQPVFNTTWFDLNLLSTTGVYNEYGATRTFSIGDNVTLTEKVRYAFPNNNTWIALMALAHRGGGVSRRVIHSTLQTESRSVTCPSPDLQQTSSASS